MLEVSCAIIEYKEKVLICQRSSSMELPLKWEFPGGKLENNESKETCLIREIKEELGLTISIKKEIQTVIHEYPSFKVKLYAFICNIESGFIIKKEHCKIAWVTKSELLNYYLAEADIPVVKHYIKN